MRDAADQHSLQFADRLLSGYFFLFSFGTWIDAVVFVLGPSPSQLACMRVAAMSVSGLSPCSPGPRLTDLPSRPDLVVSLSPQPCPAIPGSVWSRFPSPALILPHCSLMPQPGPCHFNCSVQVGHHQLNNGKGHKIHDFSVQKNAQENIWGYSSQTLVETWKICLKTALWSLQWLGFALSLPLQPSASPSRRLRRPGRWGAAGMAAVGYGGGLTGTCDGRHWRAFPNLFGLVCFPPKAFQLSGVLSFQQK